MTVKLNNRDITINEFVKLIILSVLEDVEINFDDYAKIYIKGYELSDEERDELNRWKAKIMGKMNAMLKATEVARYV